MKINSIDKETKKTKMQYILPIAKAGLGVGITALLIKTGIVDYNNIINWENYDNMANFFNNSKINNLPHIDTNIIFDTVKTAITTIGINTFLIGTKALGLAREVAKPIHESIKDNPTIHKIKEKLLGKDIIKKEQETKKSPKALANLARNGLSIGFMAYMIAIGQIDYNSVYDFTKLPHKFANIGKIAQNLDLNKVHIGIDSLKVLPQFWIERHFEKQEGMPLIKPISFKDIFNKILKNMTLPRFDDIKPIGRELQIEHEPQISSEKNLIEEGR